MDVTTSPKWWVRLPLAALSGLLAGYAALAVAELVSAAVRPQSGPLAAVGGAAIDRTPAPVKDFAIRHFGESDKLVLQLGILATIAALAIVIGLIALRYRRAGSAGILLFGIIGVGAAISRPDSTGITDGLPSVVGAIAGAGLLYWLIGRLTTARGQAGPPAEPRNGAGWDRRGFLIAATAAAVASTGAGALGRSLNGMRGQSAVASRGAVRIPPPASPAAAIPARAQLKIRGISLFVTPNKDFYRVDTALMVPKVDASTCG